MQKWTLAAVLVISVSCGSTVRELDGQAAVGAKGAATPTPAPTAGQPSGSPASGWIRIHDDAGGWSMDMPQGWFERSAPQHGHEFRSYDPSIPNPGNFDSSGLPPIGEVYVRMQMQQDPDQLDPTSFFKPAASGPGFDVREHEQVTVGRQRAEFWSIWHSQPSDFQRLEPTFAWYVRSPFFNDRMVVITAAPGESPLRAQVERIVASLQFYPPAPVALTPTLTRQQALAQFDGPAGPQYPRIEAKLVLYKEWERAGASGSRAYTVDPDTLVWVVAYTGPGIQTRHGDPCAWGVNVFAARPPETAGVFQCGPGAWPTWFDQLVDRDH